LHAAEESISEWPEERFVAGGDEDHTRGRRLGTHIHGDRDDEDQKSEEVTAE
jgi:hypothetical protein